MTAAEIEMFPQAKIINSTSKKLLTQNYSPNKRTPNNSLHQNEIFMRKNDNFDRKYADIFLPLRKFFYEKTDYNFCFDILYFRTNFWTKHSPQTRCRHCGRPNAMGLSLQIL
jgi:hypothetical protein